MNYKIHDRELLAIIQALRHWSHLLCMTVLPVIIWTDHKNLTYWAAPQKVGPRAATWQVELQQYNYELRHKPGEQNKADALSRRPNYDKGNPMNNHLIVLPHDHFAGMPPSILESLEQHPHIECSACTEEGETLDLRVMGLGEEGDTIIEDNLDNQVKDTQEDFYALLKTWQEPHNLRIDHENFFWKDLALVVVENNSLKRGVLSLFHTSKAAGHPGISKTLSLIQPHYWWPHMRDFITNYVKGCATC
jgi:hypothetical protein